MRVLLAVLLFAAFALADLSYTGRFVTGDPTFLLPEQTGTSVCTATTGTNYYYKVFNQTFSTAGVRYIQAAESDSSIYIYIYRGSFTSATPCVNVVAYESYDNDYEYDFAEQIDNTQALDVSSAVYLYADNYFFVVASSSAASSGSSYDYAFGIKVIDAVNTQQTTLLVDASTNWWLSPYQESDYTDSFDTGIYADYNNTYISYSWTPTVSGRFDIGAFAVNSSNANNDVSLAIFQGNPTAAQISNISETYVIAQGNPVAPHQNQDYDGVWVFYFNVVAGNTYTFVASIEDSEEGTAWIGFFVTPTAASRLTPGGAVVFSAPNTYYSSDPCTLQGSGYTGLPYSAYAFPVSGNIALTVNTYDSYNEYLGADLEATYFYPYEYFYNGNNTDSPSGCPATFSYIDNDYGSTTFYDGDASGAVHTVIITVEDDSTTYDPTYGTILYSFGGPTLGEGNNIPPTPAPSTSSPSTSSPSTSSPSTSSPSTSSPSPSTPAPCRNVITSGTIAFNNAVGQCSNATVQAVLSQNGKNGNSYVCTNGTGLAVSIAFSANVSTCTPFNVTQTTTYLQSQGFTDVTITLATAAPTPTTSTPTTSTPTTSTPAPAAGTTSGAASVVASFVAVFAVLALVL